MSPDGKRPARLNLSMLANTKTFVSPLFHLLNELRADGHDVSAPWDEAIAMRDAIIAANNALEEIYMTAIEATVNQLAHRGIDHECAFYRSRCRIRRRGARKFLRQAHFQFLSECLCILAQRIQRWRWLAGNQRIFQPGYSGGLGAHTFGYLCLG